MVTGSMVFSALVLALALFVIMKVTRFRHRFLAIILIALILVGYFSFNIALGGHEVDLTTAKGVGEAFGIYFSWLGTAFGNAQTITSRVVENNSEDDMAGK